MIKHKRNPNHIDFRYINDLANAIYHGNPNVLARTIIYYNQGYYCKDCGEEYFLCTCEFCNDCAYPTCLCDTKISTWYHISNLELMEDAEQLKKERNIISKESWKIAKKTLNEKQLLDLEKKLRDWNSL